MKTRKNKKGSLRGFWFIIALIIIAVVLILLESRTSKTNSSQATTNDSPYSDEQLHTFWDRELQLLIAEEWSVAKLPYTEVNARFTELNAKIRERTQKSIAVSMSTKYHWASKLIQAASGANETNGTITIELYISALLDEFGRFRASGRANWHDMFHSHMIVIVMHEMEHAGYNAPFKHIEVEEESRAWAETCRHTITPLVERYGLPLYSSEEDLYRAWQSANGDTRHPAWSKAMWNLYGSVQGKTNK